MSAYAYRITENNKHDNDKKLTKTNADKIKEIKNDIEYVLLSNREMVMETKNQHEIREKASRFDQRVRISRRSGFRGQAYFFSFQCRCSRNSLKSRSSAVHDLVRSA